MTDVTISVRVDKALHEEMKLHEEINWSAVLRKSIKQKIEESAKIDTRKALRATMMLRRLRRQRAFDKGRTTGELIREWRDKRR